MLITFRSSSEKSSKHAFKNKWLFCWDLIEICLPVSKQKFWNEMTEFLWYIFIEDPFAVLVLSIDACVISDSTYPQNQILHCARIWPSRLNEGLQPNKPGREEWVPCCLLIQPHLFRIWLSLALFREIFYRFTANAEWGSG